MTETALAVKEERGLSVIALKPEDMKLAQHDIMGWCDKRIASLAQEAEEAHQNWEVAQKSKWRSSPFRNLENKLAKQIKYYQKIKAAVGEGYLIMPNFPIDVFAIRSKAASPKGESTYTHSANLIQRTQHLPLGEGENRSPQATLRSYELPEKNAKGEDVKRTHYCADDWLDIEFPAVLVKPQIIELTTMALRAMIFDEVGLVANAGRGDPIVVGRITDPTRRGKSVNFFIAWWLRAEDL